MMIVQSKVREYVKEQGDFKVASDFLQALDQQLSTIIKQACERAKLNGRKTVSARDV